MYIKNKSTKKVRNRNWSYGGTAILHAMEGEGFKGSDKVFYRKHLHPKKKLYFLLAKFRNNPFYKSLWQQSKRYDFTAKQLDCIDRDYAKYFSETERCRHIS